jgi:uncharacterized protein YndB with AHSA1/START domain
MSKYDNYQPGPASGADIEKVGDTWTLVLTRELRHAPQLVWEALTDPAQLAAWAPFEADRNMGTTGSVKLTAIGAPKLTVSETAVKRAEAPRLLEYSWGGGELRWELEPLGAGTRLKLWHNINRGYIAWGAAGWHICLDVLDRFIAGNPVGRLVGPEAMQHEGWQRLSAEYAKQFGVELPSFQKG